MKTLFYIAAMLILVSCNSQSSEEESTTESHDTEMTERSIGFNTAMEDSKFHLGTEEAVDVVREFDKLWVARNYDGMRTLMVDTATCIFPDGKVFKSADEAIASIKEDDASSSPSWTFDYAFSVDLDPSRGGEHVQAGFTVKATEEGEEKNSKYHESYYVVDGKIVWYTSYKLAVKEDK